jgi:hypothetical protein
MEQLTDPGEFNLQTFSVILEYEKAAENLIVVAHILTESVEEQGGNSNPTQYRFQNS